MVGFVWVRCLLLVGGLIVWWVGGVFWVMLFGFLVG